MKKSSAVRLTIVAAAGIAAHAQSRPDPCAAATFNEAACEAAVAANGYCWNNRWVTLKYHYPFPYYYDAYHEFLAGGGVPYSAAVGACGPPRHFLGIGHSVSRAGFGCSGAAHSAHG